MTGTRTARITRRLPVATSALILIWWAGIALTTGTLDQLFYYSWLHIPPGYVIAAAYLIGVAQLTGMALANRSVIRIASVFGAAWFAFLAVNISTLRVGVPGWGAYGGLSLLNVALWFAPGVWVDDRISFKRPRPH